MWRKWSDTSDFRWMPLPLGKRLEFDLYRERQNIMSTRTTPAGVRISSSTSWD